MNNARIRQIDIARFPISLGQFLKLVGLVDCGAAAKEWLAQGKVLVNGEIVHERGRKLRVGDQVAAGETRFVLQENEGDIKKG
ncbi:MAG: RNA-binding S4 domain-containing protein [Desulfobulbaceae bacterium]|jgi:ribosome-associated protein|nr:RNA-binding S4 domain-containing protein [Desulfobulbaceae bacterium]